MTTPMSGIAALFTFNTSLLETQSRQFTDEQWTHRLGQASSAYWILGHITHYRALLLGKLDGTTTSDLAQFAKGSTSPDSLDPSPADLLARNQQLSQALADLLPTLTPDQLAEPSGRKFPTEDETLFGMINFLYFHDSYHIGQLGILNRALGNAGIGR